MTYLFWCSLIFLVYPFVGYPVVLWIISTVFRRRHHREAIEPSVSVIIAGYNMAAVIHEKIINTLALTYPRDKCEILIASDASEDTTAEAVRSFASQGVQLIELQQRYGKHYAQMVAVGVAKGEILVFTDATIHLEADALLTIVSNFADRSVGCVSSVDTIVASKRAGAGERLYVRFEMWLRSLEAQVGSLVSLSGSFFAARREVCDKWHPDQSSDFFLALHAKERGLRAILDPECRSFYSVVSSNEAELKRKIRTIVHGLDVVFTHRQFLNPLRYGFFSWQLASHKLFRWLAPFATVLLFVSNIFLWKVGAFYRLTMILQAILYGAGLLGLVARPLAQVKPFKLAAFFLLGNAATLTAWMKYCAGEKFVTWQPSRRTQG